MLLISISRLPKKASSFPVLCSLNSSSRFQILRISRICLCISIAMPVLVFSHILVQSFFMPTHTLMVISSYLMVLNSRFALSNILRSISITVLIKNKRRDSDYEPRQPFSLKKKVDQKEINEGSFRSLRNPTFRN